MSPSVPKRPEPDESTPNPWVRGCHEPDLDALARQLEKTLIGGKWPDSEGGALGKALDRWVADELYRAGYEPGAVSPLPGGRFAPVAVTQGLARSPKYVRESSVVARFIQEATTGLGGSQPGVIGEFYRKKTDVLVADWDRGVELLVSTKGMTDSFSNNVNNRWEEFVGELRNLRGRYPLATLGAFYLADSEVANDTAFPRVMDMLRKLRSSDSDRSAFDATGLVLAQPSKDGVTLRPDLVPPDLQPGCFFQRLLLSVFERMPVNEREYARKLYAFSIRTLAAKDQTAKGLSKLNDCQCDDVVEVWGTMGATKA